MCPHAVPHIDAYVVVELVIIEQIWKLQYLLLAVLAALRLSF
jgi:hypothetical protein